jgi:hypothetical protein
LHAKGTGTLGGGRRAHQVLVQVAALQLEDLRITEALNLQFERRGIDVSATHRKPPMSMTSD